MIDPKEAPTGCHPVADPGHNCGGGKCVFYFGPDCPPDCPPCSPSGRHDGENVYFVRGEAPPDERERCIAIVQGYSYCQEPTGEMVGAIIEEIRGK